MLTGVRVLERTVGIAGGYCGKLLADAGADVVKVEPADGDPLRSSGSGALFEFLNESKTLAPHAENAAADALLVDRAAEPVTPSQVVVCITPFGLDGPWTGRPATEFTLQAAAGSPGPRASAGAFRSASRVRGSRARLHDEADDERGARGCRAVQDPVRSGVERRDDPRVRALRRTRRVRAEQVRTVRRASDPVPHLR